MLFLTSNCYETMMLFTQSEFLYVPIVHINLASSCTKLHHHLVSVVRHVLVPQ
jgi:hypothetical protein